MAVCVEKRLFELRIHGVGDGRTLATSLHSEQRICHIPFLRSHPTQRRSRRSAIAITLLLDTGDNKKYELGPILL